MEQSYKFSLEELAALADQSGFELTKTWMDSQSRFSSNLLRVRET